MKGKLLSTKRVLTIFVVAALAVLIGALALVGRTTATPPSGVSSTTIADGNLPEPVRLKFRDESLGFGSGLDIKRILTLRLEAQPGGTFGWHLTTRHFLG